jgi:hypothetical protein
MDAKTSELVQRAVRAVRLGIITWEEYEARMTDLGAAHLIDNCGLDEETKAAMAEQVAECNKPKK